MSRQDWGTPWEFIRAVEERFGKLYADLACTKDNKKAVIGICLDEGHDALKEAWWKHGNLWLNPPFANIEPWAAKCAEESTKRTGLILMLTPASIGTDWFAKHVHRKAMVFGLSPRMTFEGAEDPYPKDLMISVYGAGINGFDCWRWK